MAEADKSPADASPERVFLSPPHMGGEELELVRQAFASGYIAPMGPQVSAFEEDFARVMKRGHALAVTSGTAAMHLALRVLGVGPGDVVLASTLTFIGSVTPAVFQGAELVFVDSEESSWNMDPALLEEALAHEKERGKVPKVVLPTDLYGQCADLDTIKKACRPYGTRVVADSAESMGALYKGEPAGKGADLAVYSFNGNKIITTSGGGMLASDHGELITRARHLATQARDDAPHYQHSQIGYNYRMSNILAAIGIAQLGVLPQRVEAKHWIFDFYRQALGGVPGLEFMPTTPHGRPNHWLTVILVDPDEFGVDREQLRLALEEGNIESRPVWKPMHLQPVFQGSRVYGGRVSEGLFERGLCLPSGTQITEADIKRVVSIIKTTRR
ncbi:MAG: aminotransferase class I/II-fold pyridoxal phosphate-dependent enzyme [Desulfarculaceae bacterium]|nr:aminotransferase class I/II-fold pyridoxal phosphate-dependent enzyme [Desulfarculaceae bacterium]MCF8118299.1 aminotransferase class I/II-fold pyridoxal phosphate-dependent enzyme [Desulfarculaceae bacterium]